MYCYQCQEAAGGNACTKAGVCGKNEDVSNLQDLLIYTLKGISYYGTKLLNSGASDKTVDQFITESLFTTITNANFDKAVFIERISKALDIRDALWQKCIEQKITLEDHIPDAAMWQHSPESFEIKAKNSGILETESEDVRSLRELLTYGIKGMAAYSHHAKQLGYEDDDQYAFIQRGLAATLDDSLTAEELVGLVLECGKFGVDVMALLDKANTETYGNPEITKVNIGVKNNPAILISGHDLKDLEELLEQTKDTGVDVYTHGEMLPAHYYPAFKQYDNFIGNYGNAWWKQKEEFETFNGPILFTTNCIVPPKDSYKERVYTTGASGFMGCIHIPDGKNGKSKDFSQIIDHAKKCDPPVEIENGEIVGGFAHEAVFAVADKVVAAVKNGDIKQFIVMAGCDGRMKSRSYYTEFAEELPEDTVILTAGCAKYRYNKLDLGEIDGIPRVLDAGQCNDSYSLVVIALKLKEIFELEDINELPISYNIAWYEQKAVTVLLALLYLGVKNIHLGPTLPAFLSQNVANVLVETFGVGGIGAVQDDIDQFLSGKKDPDEVAV